MHYSASRGKKTIKHTHTEYGCTYYTQ